MKKVIGVPYGNRTRVAAVKGRCPRPLDERDAYGEQSEHCRKSVNLLYRFENCQTSLRIIHRLRRLHGSRVWCLVCRPRSEAQNDLATKTLDLGNSFLSELETFSLKPRSGDRS
jgi:hypothetical protein